MAFWGVAAALGPDINNPEISPDDVQLAKSAIATARAVEREGDGDRERADRGDRKRYSLDGSDEAIKCERSYATALLDLGKRFPGDPDVGALGAEALMIVQGKTSVKEKRALEPKKEIATILERILKECPDHPFALHLWIHSMDQLRQPERARTESDRLRQLAPGIGHLMHMPSHVDIRLGRWHDAVVANERAVAADHVFRRALPLRGSHASYMAHSQQMLVYAAMMQGQSRTAAQAAEAALGLIPEWEAKADPGTFDVFKSVPYEIRIRFGQWDAILAEPEPGFSFPFSCAIRHFARGIAFAAKRKVSQAKSEQEEFIEAPSECRQPSFSASTVRAPCSTLPTRCWRERFSIARGKSRMEWRRSNPPWLPRTSWIIPILLFGCSLSGTLWGQP